MKKNTENVNFSDTACTVYVMGKRQKGRLDTVVVARLFIMSFSEWPFHLLGCRNKSWEWPFYTGYFRKN